MRILQLAPLWERVPPSGYGGTEAVVDVLCRELVRRGVDVTLYASGDSSSPAPLRSFYHRSLRTATDLKERTPYEWMHVALSLREAGEFDLVHNHAGELPMAMSHLTNVPMLSTMHCLITPDTRLAWQHYQGRYNTISRAEQRAMEPFAGGTFAGVVHNAVDVDSFPFSSTKNDHLLFLSRMAPEKAPHLAIQAARRLGKQLIMAGKVDRYDQEYFDSVVRPLIDGEQIVFLGEADGHQKRALYQWASCLLMPLDWEEPFGLVMVEAMACGTPVIAFARGAAPELIVDGETGFLVDDVDAMVRAYYRLDRIDPGRCRQHVADRFSPGLMAGRYVEMYRAVLDQAARRRRLTAVPQLAASSNGHKEQGEALAIA